MDDEDRAVVDHALFIRDMQIKQLSNQQLSPYMRIWVLSVEAILLGMGMAALIFGGITWGLHGFAAGKETVTSIVYLTGFAVLVLTIFLRVVWTLITVR